MKKFRIIFLLTVLALLMVTMPLAMAEAVDAVPMVPRIDLTPLFQAVIALLGALITFKLVPWIQARTTAEQQAMLTAAVRVAVFAAEQLYGTGAGKQKLLYVKAQLAKKGYALDIDEIEAAVRELTIMEETTEVVIPVATDPLGGN